MSERLAELIIHALVLLTAFPVHESAHALTAHCLGDDTARNQGRISLNPVRHLDLWGTIFMLFLGFGWAKPVPINADNFRNRKVGMAVSSLAGPFSNLILSYISIIVYKILYYGNFIWNSAVVDALCTVFRYSVFLNIGLAVFNLLPIPPLDGSRIFNLVLPEKLYFKVMKYENIIFGILCVVLWTGLLDTPLAFLQGKTLDLMDTLSGWVDKIMFMILR